MQFMTTFEKTKELEEGLFDRTYNKLFGGRNRRSTSIEEAFEKALDLEPEKIRDEVETINDDCWL